MNESETGSAGPAPQLPAAAGVGSAKTRVARAAAAACGWCTFGGAAGYAIKGPAMVAAALATAVIAVLCAVIVLRSVLLSSSDPRSPFVRFMLLACLLTGRSPGDYLPPDPGER